jgi:hypothetical protein
MWIPFSKEINAAFESDGRLPTKLWFGALFGLFFGVFMSINADPLKNSPPLVFILLIGGFVVLAVVLVVVLSLKDVIRIRIASGQPVHVLQRLILASGYVSLTLWVLLAFVTTIIMAVAWP